MRKFLVKIAAGALRVVNLPFRPLPLREKVAIISRQSDTPTLDIRMLDGCLQSHGVQTVVLTKTLQKSFGGALSYCGQMLKQVYHIATSRVVVLDGYCIPASVLPRKKGQRIVQMWHALGAVKKFGWQNIDNPDGHSADVAEAMKMHRNYDYVLAPSHVTGKFFAEAFRTPEEKLVYLGLPRIDFIKAPDEEMCRRLYARYPGVQDKVNVLYVPTFRKNAALGMEKLVAGFPFGEMNLIIKKHFLDTADYSWAEKAGAIVDAEFSSLDWMKVSQKVVTDYSAISFEAAIIDRELYIFQPDIDKYSVNNGLNVDMYDEAIRDYVCVTEEELFAALARPYDKHALAAFKRKYLEINMDHCTEQLCNFILSLLSSQAGERYE
ncbi:MAG: CDP-glycerol glycerophosphotransferase family protein [Clostridiales bacterium]|nr:CDP-glycerol glycerophosphotransferase family protein [Candidatus Cacconaster stercorequi]